MKALTIRRASLPGTPQPTPCRVWQGRTSERGYGVITRRRLGRGKSVDQRLHRWIWEQAYGPIPDGLVVMHLCDNPPCFRLDHLQLGTHADNMADAVAKGRHTSQVHDVRSWLDGHAPPRLLSPEQHQEVMRRLAAGEHQTALGAELGVSQKTIWRIGQQLPPMGHPNARKTHCPSGHEYSPENTGYASGARVCKACRADVQRRYRAKKKRAEVVA